MQLRQSKAHLSINHFHKCLKNDYLDPYDAGKMVQSAMWIMVASSEWIYLDQKTLLDYQILTPCVHLKTNLGEIGRLAQKLKQF